MATSKFGAKTPARPAPPTTRFAGIKAAVAREPQLAAPAAGEFAYRVEITGVEKSYNKMTGKEWIKPKFTVLLADDTNGAGDGETKPTPDGTESTALFSTLAAGLSRYKAFIVAACGVDEDTYDAHDPSGTLLAATIGEGADDRAERVVGRVVDVVVRRGKATDKGDYYREYAWSIADCEQPHEVFE